MNKTARVIFSLIVVSLLAPTLWAKDCLAYFGTFTDTTSKGIYVSHLDEDTGKLSTPELAVAVDSPNYLAVSPDRRFLFAAVRADNKNNGAICSFSINAKTGSLTLLDRKSSGGTGPCYVGLDAPDQCLLAANYNGGTVKALHVSADGILTDGNVIQHTGKGVNPKRQEGPHPHCFVSAPKGRFALACDLGLDKVMIYKVNPADGTITPNDPPFATVPPGSGPPFLLPSVRIEKRRARRFGNGLHCDRFYLAWQKGQTRRTPKHFAPAARRVSNQLYRGGNCLPA